MKNERTGIYKLSAEDPGMAIGGGFGYRPDGSFYAAHLQDPDFQDELGTMQVFTETMAKVDKASPAAAQEVLDRELKWADESSNEIYSTPMTGLIDLPGGVQGSVPIAQAKAMGWGGYKSSNNGGTRMKPIFDPAYQGQKTVMSGGIMTPKPQAPEPQAAPARGRRSGRTLPIGGQAPEVFAGRGELPTTTFQSPVIAEDPTGTGRGQGGRLTLQSPFIETPQVPTQAPVEAPATQAPQVPTQAPVEAPATQAPQVAANVPSAPMQPIAPETMQPQTPVTGPTFQGQPLSEYLAGGIQLDPQGRMIDPDVDRSAFEQASEARSMAAGNSIRPGVDVPSLAMQRARMDAGLDPVAGAPMGTGMSQQQQRDMLDRGFDPATGKKIDSGDDMTDYQKATLAQREREFETRQANINREWEASQRAIEAEKAKGVAATQESIQKETDRLDSQLGFLEGAAMEMAGLSNWTTEGVIGAGLGKLPFETNKKQVDRIANSFMGNAFLRSIIDSKSLGATFGALSNQEGEKITGAETILMDGSMSNERRLRAAADIIGTIKSAKARALQRMAKTQSGSQPSQDTAPVGEAPKMEGFTFKVKN